jgi:hypothetical protein
MGVLKNKRGLSKLEFYHTARKLRKDLTEFVRREFGVHSRNNAKRMNPELPDDYYDEDIVEFGRNVRLALRNMMWNITGANSIYARGKPGDPVFEAEMVRRRQYQDAAIINCQQLIQEMQFAEDSLPVDANKFIPYVKELGKEIMLLKGWRKSDNKIWGKTDESK